jgi:hypothetical protein
MSGPAADDLRAKGRDGCDIPPRGEKKVRGLPSPMIFSSRIVRAWLGCHGSYPDRALGIQNDVGQDAAVVGARDFRPRRKSPRNLGARDELALALSFRLEPGSFRFSPGPPWRNVCCRMPCGRS